MKNSKKIFLLLIFLLSLIIFFYFSINKFQKEKHKAMALEPISINLLTSVHPNLPWNFETLKKNDNRQTR